MAFDYKILKINRHLFDYGTSKLNRVLRSFVLWRVVGSIPTPMSKDSSVVEHQTVNLWYEKVKNRAEMLKLKLSMQDKGYRLDNLFKLNLASLIFGVFCLFSFENNI